ncbi:MAG: hypothetical protein ABJB11_02960 [Ferruginibacter sp.]
MSRKNEKMIVQGYYSDNSLGSIEMEQPYSDTTAGIHYGMPVTGTNFLQMLERFRQAPSSANPPFRNLWWVEFSKASIFRILAQEECEYVRMYFVIPDATKNEVSLALHGVDSAHNTIHKEGLLELCQSMQGLAGPFNDPDLLQNLTNQIPAIEEKGNGGTGFPLSDAKNVKSMDDFYTELEKDNLNFNQLSLCQFVEKFLVFADK